ncbi:MAG: flap endonuclease-1 [Acidilobaceae archaeon]|nr:flap endonuclease-1 [Acidilobaceae archaeon]MCX8165452.1 flap endonuclease-1 [Acidilobaceae archaeon]MDW7973879.1 flap endonuclease-1 [Sulfolobales archaeon]
MGLDLGDIVPEAARREVEISALKGEVIALDAYNALYQFLAAIRQPDGTPLVDRQGRITSHLSGLFYRTISLLEEGVKPVYVFDGRPPEMKRRELEERQRRKAEAEKRLKEAREAGLVEEARRSAQAAARLTQSMATEAKELLSAMGLPWVQAPEEGEAQAAFMTRRDAFAAGSQDYDSLLFGARRLVRNLTFSGKRKLPGREEYVEVKPEVIDAEALLRSLGVSREQLIAVGVIMGTDYNEGIRGYGALRALKHVRAVGDPLKALQLLEGWEEDPLKVYEYFLNPPVNEAYTIAFGAPDERKIKEILIYQHDFSPDRVEKGLERLRKAMKELKGKQRRLDSWFQG